ARGGRHGAEGPPDPVGLRGPGRGARGLGRRAHAGARPRRDRRHHARARADRRAGAGVGPRPRRRDDGGLHPLRPGPHLDRLLAPERRVAQLPGEDASRPPGRPPRLARQAPDRHPRRRQPGLRRPPRRADARRRGRSARPLRGGPARGPVKVARVETFHLGRSLWAELWEREKDLPLVTPLSGYPEYRHPYSRWYWEPAMTLVVLTADDGSTGLGWTEDGVAAARAIIERHLARFVLD